MHIWPVQDAKARFSEFLDTCLEDGPQVVSRRGTETAVLVPIGQWRKLLAASQPTLKDLLLSDTARADLDIPARTLTLRAETTKTGKQRAIPLRDGLVEGLAALRPIHERVLGRALAQPGQADNNTGSPQAPGMLASHYAPRTKVRLDAGNVEAGEVLLAFGSNAVAGVDAATIVMNLSAKGDLAEAAANLFGYLRALDAHGARAIAVMPVPNHGLGEAINDRLRRAAIERE